MLKEEKYNKNLVVVIAAIAATGGLLFGFDTGVISGAIPFFQQDFQIGNSMVENITTAGLVGAVIGAMFTGRSFHSRNSMNCVFLTILLF